MLSCGLDKALHIWDLKEGRQVYTVLGHEGAAHDVAWTPDGQSFLSGAADNLVLLWNAAELAPAVPVPVRPPSKARPVTPKPARKTAPAATPTPKAKPSAAAKTVKPTPKPEPPVPAPAPAPDETTLAPELIAQSLARMTQQLELVTQTVKLMDERMRACEAGLRRLEGTREPVFQPADRA